MVRRWLFFGLVVILLAVVYRKSLNAPFIFDDNHAIVENAHLHHIWPPTAPPQSTLAGRPVVTLSLSINHAIHGLDVSGYRLTNLLIHVGCTLLLFGLVRRLLQHIGHDAESEPLAMAITLIWAVHPLASETVIYIVQRTELLVSLFMLLTLYAFVRGATAKQSAIWLGACVIACALGMASKEVMVGAPLIVLLIDRAWFSETFKQAISRRKYLYVGLAATWGILIACMVLGPRSDSVGWHHGVSPIDYLRTQAGVIGWYLKQVVAPTELSISHHVPIATQWHQNLLPGVVLLVALLLCLYGSFVRRWSAAVVGLIFFILLAPSSSFVPIVTEVAAERRMYLPLAAVIALAATVAVPLGKKLRIPWQIGVVFASAVTMMGVVTTQHRAAVYQSEVKLWQDAVNKQPHNVVAQSALGMSLVKAGRIEQGMSHLNEALRIEPNHLEAHANLSAAHLLRRDNEEAIKHARRAIELNPRRVMSHVNLGLALLRLDRLDEAREAFEAALALNQMQPEANYYYAYLLVQADDAKGATTHLRRSLSMSPDNADAHDLLGVTLMMQNHRDEALTHFKQALKINPDHADAQKHLKMTEGAQ